MKPAGVTALTAGLVLAIGLPFVLSRAPSQAGAAGATAAGRAAFAVEGVASTADVQGLDQLWRALTALRAQAAELGAQEFLAASVALTAEYLKLEGEQADRFADTAARALAELAAARADMFAVTARVGDDPEAPDALQLRRDAWAAWQEGQQAAADRLLEALQPRPRHGLLAEERAAWLLRLDAALQAAARGER